MFVFAHLGIGNALAKPWSKNLPKNWILIGTLVPDLVDKPLYYLLSLFYGKTGADLGLISCTRTICHSGIFLILLTLTAIVKRSRILAAISIGIATHLLIDNVGDQIFSLGPSLSSADQISSSFMALVFPLYGFRFGVMPFHTAKAHVESYLFNSYLIGAEIIGIILLAWDYWQIKRQVG